MSKIGKRYVIKLRGADLLTGEGQENEEIVGPFDQDEATRWLRDHGFQEVRFGKFLKKEPAQFITPDGGGIMIDDVDIVWAKIIPLCDPEKFGDNRPGFKM